jgi:hypothetical protein
MWRQAGGRFDWRGMVSRKAFRKYYVDRDKFLVSDWGIKSTLRMVLLVSQPRVLAGRYTPTPESTITLVRDKKFGFRQAHKVHIYI